MDINKIKDKINGNEYDFLRKDPTLNNICLLTLGGSISYGTDIPGKSDIDLRGVYLNPKNEILTMDCKDKPFEDKNTDTVIYPFKQMTKLLLENNPNTLEIFGTKQEHILKINENGKLIRDNVDLFISKIAIIKFGAYAVNQLRRLQNALAHDSYPQAEKEEHILKSVNKQMSSMIDRYKEFDLNLYIDDSDKADYDKEIFMDINLNHYPLRDFKNVYAEMSNTVRDYDKLNHRNSKKDEVHLFKHAMHLLRILICGKEIAEGRGINTYRTNDRQLLLDIRNGKYTYKEIFELVDKYDNEFKYAAKNTCLPDKPPMDKISEIIITINNNVLSNS